ncbi:mRNA-decapping enzyme 1B-like [Patiria miniata]|uniref:mRNA-decapping enzyme C-terminal domain-containing protein n=1 Tax=Patiria miniata TaxID=46514 RepID=A0A914AX28_PATMI|nr:mRNA-decapping enzyme 1B-like [Patiria miniata]
MNYIGFVFIIFVFVRSATPYNGFMIMNRLSMNNLTEPVTKELEFQLQDPFLLYKTAQSIYGLWFYDKTECLQVARLMESLVHKAKKRAKGLAHRSRSVSESDAGPSAMGQAPEQVDIMQMLSRAQQNYDKNQKGDKEPERTKKPKSPPTITSGSPTVVRPVPVKAEDGGTDQEVKQTEPVTNEVMGQMSQGPATHPGFQRSVSMQANLGYLAVNAGASGQSSPGKVNDILQKLLANPGEGAAQHAKDYPLSHRQIQTVESLERRQSQKQALEGKTTDQGLGQGSTVRTVESIEKQHANATVMESTEEAQGYPIQDLLAKLNIAQQNQPTGQQETTEGHTIVTQPLSQGGLAQLQEAIHRQNIAGNVPSGLRTSTEEVQGESDPDINQKLLTNLAARAAVQTAQPSSNIAQLQLIHPSAIRPNPPIRPQGGRIPVNFPGNQQVPSLQQLASGRQQHVPMVPTQTTTNGITAGAPTSPQKIPGSLHPPTLLTPQAFRKRSASETVQMTHPSQLFPPVAENVAVQHGPQTNQHPAMGHPVSSSRHSPLLNRVEIDRRVNTAGALNKEQFKQAFVHLLQTDGNFLSSLHNAYLQTLHLNQ